MSTATVAEGYPFLDVLYPFSGPCGFCGDIDKRHRLADALLDNYRGGDSPERIAEAFDWPEVVTVPTILALIERAELNRKRHKARWT